MVSRQSEHDATLCSVYQPAHTSIISCSVDHQNRMGLLRNSAQRSDPAKWNVVHAQLKSICLQPSVRLCRLVSCSPFSCPNPVALPYFFAFKLALLNAVWFLPRGKTEADLLGCLSHPSPHGLPILLAYSRLVFFVSESGGRKDKDGYLETAEK